MARFMRFFVALLTFCTVLAASVQAASVLDQRKNFTASYGVYGGGIQALAIDLSFDLDNTEYTAAMKAKPHGTLGKLLPWAGEYETTGSVKKGALIPSEHDRTSAWRDDQSRTIMTYQNGVLKNMKRIEEADKKSIETEQSLDATLHKNTIDLVSAVTDVLIKASDKKTCNYTREVFDGKRRFRMVFKDEGTQKLTASGVNIFSGPAYVCRMELVPLKGFTGKPRGYYRIQEEARKKGELPVVWLGRAWAGGPMIPVRMMIKSEYGTVLMHLKKITR